MHIHIHICGYINLHFVLERSNALPWSREHNTRSIDYALVSIFCRCSDEIRSLYCCPYDDETYKYPCMFTDSIERKKKVCASFPCVAKECMSTAAVFHLNPCNGISRRPGVDLRASFAASSSSSCSNFFSPRRLSARHKSMKCVVVVVVHNESSADSSLSVRACMQMVP
jgi:hypothetical protein